MQGILIFVKQIPVMEPHQLRNKSIRLIELSHIVPNGIAVIFAQIHVPSNYGTEHPCQSAKGSGILVFACLGCHEFVEGLHIIEIVQHEIPNLITEVIDLIQISATFKCRGFIVRQEGTFDILLGVLEIQNKGAVLSESSTIKTRESLNCGNITQFLIHIHGVEQRLIKARLILVRNDQNVVLAAVERLTELFVGGDILAVFIQVHGCLGERLFTRIVIQGNFARKSNHHIAAYALIGMVGQILLDSEIITDCVCTAVCHDHSLALTANLITAVFQEIGHNHFSFLGNGITVLFVILEQRTGCLTLNEFRVILGHTD